MQKVASIKEFEQDGTMRKVKLNGVSLLIIKEQGMFYATQYKCSHLGMPLEKGKLLGNGQLQCKFHRAVFDINNGDVVKWANFPPGIQALNFVRGEKCLKTYRVDVRGEDIFVDV